MMVEVTASVVEIQQKDPYFRYVPYNGEKGIPSFMCLVSAYTDYH